MIDLEQIPITLPKGCLVSLPSTAENILQLMYAHRKSHFLGVIGCFRGG